MHGSQKQLALIIDTNYQNQQTRLPTINETIVVHIAGAVAKPGVYEIKKNLRVIQILNIAGGSLSNADLDKVNLAHIPKDGQRIYVPPKKKADY